MHSTANRVFAVVVVTVMLCACIVAALPSSSAADEEGKYGAHLEFTYQDLDDIVTDITGKSIEQAIEELDEQLENYDVQLYDPMLNADLAIVRETSQTDSKLSIHDQISGYIEIAVIFDIIGLFPDSGTYYAEEGEDTLEFLYRVFMSGTEDRNVDIMFFINTYVDVNTETTINLETGEIEDVDISIRLMEMDLRYSDIQMDMDLENPEYRYITIGYDTKRETGNFFTDLEMEVSADGMLLINDEELEWNVNPFFLVHFQELLVSSDLANSIWEIISKFTPADDKARQQLPELILNIISSSNRMLDLFQTLKSLTNRSIDDITIEAKMGASYGIDGKGYLYSGFILQNGEDFTEYDIYTGAYTINPGKLLLLIPSDIMSIAIKEMIAGIIDLLGWGEVDVRDISDDPEEQAACGEIIQHVETAIWYDEEYEFNIPPEYIIAAGTGIVLVILSLVAIRREIL